MAMRGWGRGLRKAVANWYTERENSSLALQVIKYKQRDGWSHRDALRLAHPKTTDRIKNEILNYAVHGWENVGEAPHPDNTLATIWAAERLKVDISEKEVLRLIADYRLPMEVVPTEKRSKAVYEAMLPHTGITWLIRNLGNLSKQGVIADGQFGNLNKVIDKITNVEELKKGRVHPLAVLVALNTYRAGKGVRGDSTWPVIQKLVDALDEAFYLAFEAVEPTGKRFLLGLDVSGSMTCGEIAGMPGITPRVGSAAMAMVTHGVERNCTSMAFCNQFVPFPMSKKERLDKVCARMDKMTFGSTDCSQPMVWALENKVEVDAFVVYTDSETYAGRSHPTQALQKYRDKMGIDSKLVVVGMVSNGFTIADPEAPYMLDVCGFSTDSPAVISSFAAGKL